MTDLLTIKELAEWLRLEPASVYTLMKRGILQKGIHYVKPHGLSPRFKRKAIEDWLEERDKPVAKKEGVIPMLRGYSVG